MWRRNIDADAHRRKSGIAPRARIVADAAQHPLADRHDQSRFFREGDEVRRLHESARRMVPANQRFQRNDLLAVAVEDRLVVQHQLVAFERVVEALFEREAAAVALVHAGREHLGLIAAQLLGAVHRAIGAFEERLDVIAVARKDADPDRCRDEQLVAFDAERMRERLQDFSRHSGDGLAARRIDEKDRELVAAEPRDRVGRAHATLQARRDLVQQRVAERVA